MPWVPRLGYPRRRRDGRQRDAESDPGFRCPLDRGGSPAVGFAGSERSDPRDVERVAGRADEAGNRISRSQGVRETVGAGASELDAYLDKLAQRTDERGAATLLDIASCAEDGASGSAASVARKPLRG